MSEVKLNIPKMVCDGCINNITKGLETIGLSNLEFNLENKSIKITGDNINEREILKTLKRINYPAEVIN